MGLNTRLAMLALTTGAIALPSALCLDVLVLQDKPAVAVVRSIDRATEAVSPQRYDDGVECPPGAWIQVPSHAGTSCECTHCVEVQTYWWDRGPIRRVLSWGWRGRPWLRR
jgi:hypothetical protein